MPEAKIGIYVGVKINIERKSRLRTELWIAVRNRLKRKTPNRKMRQTRSELENDTSSTSKWKLLGGQSDLKWDLKLCGRYTI
jgi:hypothetical protein